MALRSGTPVNLSALRRDYSAIPQIAAIKAQANQGIFNAIKEGIDNRKQKIKDAAETKSRQNVIQSILNTDLGKRVFGDDPTMSAKDIDVALGKTGQKNLVSILDILGKADIEEDKLKAQAEQKRIAGIKQAVKRDLIAKGLTSTGGINITPDMINELVKKYNLPEEVVAGLRGEAINEVNTIGNQKLETEFQKDPNFKKYVDSLMGLPEDTFLQEDYFNANTARRIIEFGLAGAGAGALAGGTIFSLPGAAVGAIGGLVAGGAYGAVESALQGNKEFENGLLDLRSIQEYNNILFRNPEMIQAAGLNKIFSSIGAQRLTETGGGEEVVLGTQTKVTAFGLESDDSVPTKNLNDQVQKISNNSNANTGTTLAPPQVPVMQGGRVMPQANQQKANKRSFFDRFPATSGSQIQLKQK